MKKLIALLLSLLTLSACASTSEESAADGEYGLWFAVSAESDRGDSSVVARETRQWDEEPTAADLMEALLQGPLDDGLYSPFPQGVAVRGITMDADTATIQVNLSEQYGGLAGFDLTVADYCIALTLCQLPEVDTVRVLVDGELIPYRNRQDLQAGDVLLSDIWDEPDTFLAALYFPGRNSEGLVAEYRQVARTDDSAASIAVTELLRGPTNTQTCLPMPEGTQLLSLTVDSGLCQVSLSAEFWDNAPSGEQADLTLYALVNTLCTVSGVNQVQLLREGERAASYGSVATDAPLSEKLELVTD